jgi:hypothetical protein
LKEGKRSGERRESYGCGYNTADFQEFIMSLAMKISLGNFQGFPKTSAVATDHFKIVGECSESTTIGLELEIFHHYFNISLFIGF